MPESPTQQDRAKAYARRRLALRATGWLLGVAYLELWLATGAAPGLRDALTARWASPWLVVAAFGVALAVPFEVLTFPLMLYSGFLLPHRFGQSRQTFGQWATDLLKAWGVGVVLGLVLLEGFYAICRWQPETWWLWATVAVLGFNLLMTHLGPVLLFPIFFRFAPLADGELRDRLLALCTRAHTEVQNVFTFDLGRKTRGANAALAGLGRTRRIILSDTLCEGYTPAEVEAVLAHELGHHLHGHLWRGIAASTLGTGLLFGLADRLLARGLPWAGATSIADVAGLPLLAVVLGGLGVLSLPIGNGLSRHFERQADRAALRLATEPDALIGVFEKLADHNLADRRPHPLVVWWLHGHPPIDRRIATVRAALPRAPAPAGATSV